MFSASAVRGYDGETGNKIFNGLSTTLHRCISHDRIPPQFMLKVLNNGNPLGLTALRVSRTILAALLPIALLWSVVSVTTIASSSMCTLACCAGRAPHAAGSCMNGSCQASLISHNKASHVHRAVQPSERLCGVMRITGRTTAALNRESKMLALDRSSEQRRASHAPQAGTISTAVGKPCQPDCCAGTFGSSSQSRPRESGASSYVDKLRPP